MSIWFCFRCNKGGKSNDELLDNHVCFPIKLSPTKKLLNWFLSLDILYLSSFMAGAIMNGIFISHSPLSDGERILESICWGVVMMCVFKK